MKRLVIVGAGLLGQVVHTCFKHGGEYLPVAFAADAAYAEKATEFCGLPVMDIERLESAYPPSEHEVFVAVGYRDLNRIRERLYTTVKDKGYRCPTYVHPNVVRWPETQLGENVLVLEDNTVQPFVTIGDNTLLWSGNHIGHHSTIGSHCFISSHVVISGNCTIGDHCFFGVNATIRDSTRIGARNIIGPTALILRDTEDGQVFLPKGTEARGVPSDKVKL